MNARSNTALLACLLFPATLLVMSACKSTESHESAPSASTTAETKSAKITNSFTASAQVTAVAAEKRELTLRREDGSVVELKVDPAVRNFEQIAVGDTLRVHYQETLAAKKMPAGSKAGPVEGAFTAARAKQGEKPAGGVGLMFSVRVRIESIDREHEIVNFSLSSGELIARKLQTAEGRAFAQGLKVGDIVQLDYAEGLALGIEKL